MENNYIGLDLIRGLAALAVALGHIRALVLKPLSETTLDLFGKIIYFLTGFGYQAVMVFFVLSGFFITRSVDNSFKNKSWSLKLYIINRMSRLWVVLIPCLVMTYIFDYIGLKYYSNAPFYAGTMSHMDIISVESTLSQLNFLGNLFFLQTILSPTLGSNGPLWSLSYEFWFYFLIAIIYILIYQAKFKLLTIFIGFITVIFIFIYNPKILGYFLIFLMGSSVYLFHKFKPDFIIKKYYKILIYLLFIIVLALARFNMIDSIKLDFLMGIVSSFVILDLLKTEFSGIIKQISLFSSKISYTLYLFHLPFTAFLTAMIGFQYQEYNLINIIFYIFLCIFIIGVSYFVWYIFERNTILIKNWIIKKFN